MSSFVLQPRPPLRTWLIADAVAVVGALLAVGTSEFGWPTALFAVGLVLLAAGVALIVVAIVAARRRRVTVELDAAGYRVHEGGSTQGGTWASVERLTGARGQLTVHADGRPQLRLLAPPGAEGTIEAIAAEMSRHLDADRGYRTIE